MDENAQILLEKGIRFVFRADASFEMGVGHVMRILNYAEYLDDLGFKCVFVGNIGENLWLAKRIYAMTNLIWHKEISDYASDARMDILFLDSYQIPVDDQFIKCENWRALVAIVDDKTPQYLATYYLNPGPFAGWYPPTSAKSAQIFSGVEYIPIRKSLRTIANRRTFESQTSEILIIGGGTDPHNFGGEIGSLIAQQAGDFTVTVFSNNYLNLPSDARIQQFPVGPQLDEHLITANFVFTTAGTSSWELLALNIPCAVALAVENQRANYEYFEKVRLASTIGEFDGARWKLDEQTIRSVISKVSNQEVMKINSSQFPDLIGVERFFIKFFEKWVTDNGD